MSTDVAFSVFWTRTQSRTQARPISPATNGFFLTRDELTASYVIIRHNVRTYRSDGVVIVVKGKQSAESALKELQASQTSTDQHEGWRYFIEMTDLKAGTDPAIATELRQGQLETRESKALQAIDPAMGSDGRKF